MSSEWVPPWQDVLDSLTKKAVEWNFFNEINRKNELQLAHRFLKHQDLKSYLIEWMELCLSKAAKKSKNDSAEFRCLGNEAFKRHDNTASLSHYTDAARFAPYESEEHALALANRSAVLYHLKMYNECISDAEKALALPYPIRLKHKLMIRIAKGWFQLHEWDKSETSLNLAKEILGDGTLLECDSALGARQEILTIQAELDEIQQTELKKSDRTVSTSKETVSKTSIPPLSCGLSSQLPFASAAAELRFSDQKGRYIVTNQDVQQGEILFVEKPYSFVVLPEQFKAHCHHCTKKLLAPTPCRNCVHVLFCNEHCEMTSHAGYHQWECAGMSLMSAVGVAHLGLRIILTTGELPKVLDRAHAASKHFEREPRSFGCLEDPYSTVYSLLPHIRDMTPEDIFQYAATAELLTLFLVHKTDYFKAHSKLYQSSEQETIAEICSLLLRHVAQLVCNAHAIVKLDSANCPLDAAAISGNAVVSESQQRIATAIYPSASMMNHSCDPNIISSFSNEVLIVKASRKISTGEEVFNCYGPHCHRMGTAERRAALQAQYFFFCECSACSSNEGESFDPVQERLWALRCASCSGPLLHEARGREPAGSKVSQNETHSHFMICETCGSHQPISSLVCDAFSALGLFKKGCEEMEDGRMQDALNDLIRCKQLQERALYRSNKDLTATYDMLAKCYATLGQYNHSIKFLKLILPVIEEQYGCNSVEVANELQKLSDVIMCDIRTMETTPSKEILDYAHSVLGRALSILSIHYGEWNQEWQDVQRKLQELKLMREMVVLQSGFESKLQTK